MISGTTRPAGSRSVWPRWLAAAFAGAAGALTRLERVRPLYVVAAFVVVQWLVTLGLALDVGHNGWIWYQGGDQQWFYTTSWMLRHGELVGTYVGYGWSTLLLPLTLAGGANLLQVVPAIVLLNVLVLMPVAMAAMYGIGERLGGRLAGYWVLGVWIVAPLVGIRYTDAGYHQRYTELSLPQAFGLTAMADFPSLVALAVAAYFLIRTLQRFSWADAAAAGLVAGFAIGMKPSNGLFLPGAVLAFALARRWRALVAVGIALAPSVLVLAFWKWRGLGYLPLFHAQAAVRLAVGVGGALPLAGIDFHRYLYLDWSHVQTNLDAIREHFWSVRVFEWLVVAGIVALARKALWTAALFGGWFLAFGLVKGSDPLANVDDTTLLRFLIPAIPAFVLMLAALPLLVPGTARRLPQPAPPRPWGSPTTIGMLLGAAVLLFLAVPVALTAAAHRLPDASPRVMNATGFPVPTDPGFPLQARVEGKQVFLSWPSRRSAAGQTFYTVIRGSSCSAPTSVDLCATKSSFATRATSFVDTPQGSGSYVYTVAVSANWENDQNGGDPYVAAPYVAVTIP